MRRFRLSRGFGGCPPKRLVAALGLAVLAAAPLPNARALVDPPGYQATEKDFSVERFSDASINIDNNFLPVVPGAAFP